MDEFDVSRYFANEPRGASAADGCLADDLIAAYAEGSLPAAEALAGDRHLVNCLHCRTRVARTVRLLREGVVEQAMAPQLLKQAERAAMTRSSPRPVTAVAASLVVLGIALLWTASNVSFDAPAQRDTRMLNQTGPDASDWMPELRVESALGSGDVLHVRWQAVDGALYYDLRLVDAGGDVVAAARTTDSDWTFSTTAPLEPGALYYVRVDAHLRANRTRSSRHVAYRVPDRRQQ